MQIKNKTFCILTLGCRTNICESDSISNQLLDDGAKISDDFKNANICIVNTCCVTTKAESKSKYYINQAIRSAKCELIVVIGCLSQMDAKLFQHPKIGIIIGNNGKNSILEYIHQYDGEHQILNIKKFQKSDSFEQYNNLNALERTRAFIKIQDGCDFMCSYCIIPFVRGRQRSLPHQNVLKLIKTLVDNNHKEIVLTGVNTAGYRENEKYGFLELLQSINKLKGNFRVRISSLEPFQINHKIIDLITKNKKR
jgi:threonylcarbamoyladenosine tRNA methylthiotransferase MtaB